MPEWLAENGIGEQRALLMDRGYAVAAKLRWQGELHAGTIVEAKLVRKAGTRGTATVADGREVLLDKLPTDASEGASYPVVITRAAIAERGRYKLPTARICQDRAAAANDALPKARLVRRFENGAWEEIWQAASSGEVQFAGGALLFSVTPAMTLIDIDGELSPRELALAAVPHVARWLKLFDIGGSIGIDFPTLAAKTDRKAVDIALDHVLSGFAHERTAMNGFGFVQIVTRLEGPSLLHRFATSRVAMAARMGLRQAEMVEGPGQTLLTVHPALKAKLRPEWLEELERRTGRPAVIETDSSLAIEAPHAQIVPHV